MGAIAVEKDGELFLHVGERGDAALSVVAGAAPRRTVAAGRIQDAGGQEVEVPFADLHPVVVVVGEEVDHPAAAADAAGVGGFAAPHADVPGDHLVAVLGPEPDVAAATGGSTAAGVAPFHGDLRLLVDGDRAVGRRQLHVDAT